MAFKTHLGKFHPSFRELCHFYTPHTEIDIARRSASSFWAMESYVNNARRSCRTIPWTGRRIIPHHVAINLPRRHVEFPCHYLSGSAEAPHRSVCQHHCQNGTNRAASWCELTTTLVERLPLAKKKLPNGNGIPTPYYRILSLMRVRSP